MRIMIAMALLAMSMTTHAAAAKDRVEPQAGNPKASESKSYNAEESAGLVTTEKHAADHGRSFSDVRPGHEVAGIQP